MRSSHVHGYRVVLYYNLVVYITDAFHPLTQINIPTLGGEDLIPFQNTVFPKVCAVSTLYRGVNLFSCGLFRLYIDVLSARPLLYRGDPLNAPASRYKADRAKVNLIEFPKIDYLTLARSVDLPRVEDSSSLEQSNVNDSIRGTAENAVSQISKNVQDLSDQLHLLLPEYYTVGLQSYCEGKQGAQVFSNCLGPSVSFFFDLVDLLSSRLGQLNRVLADWTQLILEGYR